MRKNQKVFKKLFNKYYDPSDSDCVSLAASGQFLLDYFTTGVDYDKYFVREGGLDSKWVKRRFAFEIAEEQEGPKVDAVIPDVEIATIETIRETVMGFVPQDCSEQKQHNIYCDLIRGAAGYMFLEKTENYAYRTEPFIQKNFHNKIYIDLPLSIAVADALKSRFDSIKAEEAHEFNLLEDSEAEEKNIIS